MTFAWQVRNRQSLKPAQTFLVDPEKYEVCICFELAIPKYVVDYGPNRARLESPMRSHQVFQYRLIDTELTAGISFFRAAETSEDPSRRAFNMEHAERACQAALDFTAQTHLVPFLQNAIEKKTAYLRHLLNESRSRRVIFTLDSVELSSKKRSAA